jgi:hypothetical protein
LSNPFNLTQARQKANLQWPMSKAVLEQNKTVMAFLTVLVLTLLVITGQQITIKHLEKRLAQLEDSNLDARVHRIEHDLVDMGIQLQVPPEVQKALEKNPHFRHF